MLNGSTVIGNLTRDVVIRTVNGSNGPTSVADIDVAVNGYANGGRTTKYYRLVAWGKNAEVIGQYGKKGTKMGFDCELPDEPKIYTKKDGTMGASISMTVRQFLFLGKAPETGSAPAANQQTAQPVSEAEEILPF